MFSSFMPIEPEAYKKAKLIASTTTETTTEQAPFFACSVLPVGFFSEGTHGNS